MKRFRAEYLIGSALQQSSDSLRFRIEAIEGKFHSLLVP